MKLSTIKRQLAFFLVNHILVGTRCYGQKRRLLNTVGHSIGRGTKVVGPVFCTGTLVTGENCWLGANLRIHGNGTVIMGKNCDIGPEVTFLTGGHAIGSPKRRAGEGKNDTIQIGDGCWIGGRATLLNAITVGKGSVLGACACAVRDIPANTLACGVPAREVRRLYE